jgi:hypothetical protein
MRPQRGGQQPQGYQNVTQAPAGQMQAMGQQPAGGAAQMAAQYGAPGGGILGQVSQFLAQPTAAAQLGAHGQTHGGSAGHSVNYANNPHNPAMQRMSGPAPAGITLTNAGAAPAGGPAGAVPMMGQGGPMADDLQAGYLHLNLPGSPLGSMGLLSGNTTRRAEIVQDAILSNEQRMMMSGLPLRGPLPITQMQQQMMMQQQMAARGQRR